jgi:hypothetical protein
MEPRAAKIGARFFFDGESRFAILPGQFEEEPT